mgnify:CR=1 FL=1
MKKIFSLIIAIVVFLLLIISARMVSLGSIIAVASMLVTVPNYQMSGVLPFVLNANGPIGANFVILIFNLIIICLLCFIPSLLTSQRKSGSR